MNAPALRTALVLLAQGRAPQGPAGHPAALPLLTTGLRTLRREVRAQVPAARARAADDGLGRSGARAADRG